MCATSPRTRPSRHPDPDSRRVALKDPDLAEQRLELLASELDRTWPDAAASLGRAWPRR